MKEIWAVEQEFLVRYLETMLNISEELKSKPAAFFGTASTQEQDIFSINGDTAIININGILSQDGPSFFDKLFGFGGTGYREIIEAIEEIKRSEEVKTVRLIMNTPGGEVNGVDSVFQAVRELGKTKTVIAESHGLIASGGYWIASAASKIIATSPVDVIGSIGVVVIGIDRSKATEERGIKVVVIRSANAPNKIPDISTEKGKNILQERVDATERVFIGRISEGRGISVETIEKTFARGSVFIAQDPDSEKPDALSVGMIDSVESAVVPSTTTAKGDHKKKSIDETKPKAEEKAMDLLEAMKDHTVASDVAIRDQLKIKEGVDKQKAEAAARIEKCKPYLTSKEYPEPIKDLAIDVISGKEEFSALRGAVTVIDSLKAKEESAAAAEETTGQEETPPEAQGGGTAPEGVCNTNEEFAAYEKKLDAGNC